MIKSMLIINATEVLKQFKMKKNVKFTIKHEIMLF